MKMAKLTYVYRSDETNCVKISKRQLPLIGGENLMMLMDLNSKGLVFDHPVVKGRELEEFSRKYKLLTAIELKSSLQVSSNEFTSVLSQSVPCVGCRRSVERLFYQLMLSGHPTLDPVIITNKGVLSVSDDKMKSPQAICTLLHKHNILLNSLLENQPRNKKSSRCSLHSLDSFRSRPFSEMWRDVWNCMKQQCKEEVAVVEATELHATLDGYLKKHKFCQECRTKVEKAYSLLVNESNPAKEKGYVAALYSGIKRCLTDKHIHLQTKIEYIDSLIKRAEPELNGSNSRHRERHAKTLEIAQEEVLTCIGMCIYERLRRIHVCLKEEENACQVLAAVAVHALSRSFDMAVEKKQGISNLELLYEEISREERTKEQKKEQKKLKKRKKRNERKNVESRSSCHSCEPEPVPEKCQCSSDDHDHNEDGKPDHDHGHEDDDDDNIVLCDGIIIDAAPKITKCCSADDVKDEVSVTSCHSCENNGDNNNICTQASIDGGYASEPHHGSCSLLSSNGNSRTSSIVSSPEGSEVACSDGFCNHDHQPHYIHGKHSSSNRSFRNTPECIDAARFGGTGGLTLSLQQMLDDSPSEDEGEDVNYIPDELIIEFKSRGNIKQQREELRQQLLNNFKRLCINNTPQQRNNNKTLAQNIEIRD